ncbi:MAG TPA: cupin domain-containing protein [Candidatus Eremiobacteraceae bacterium]|nr:cupin domain-containing protein [Candidatus Eremiobacteraceae bacterium]
MKHEFDPASFSWRGIETEGYRAGREDLPDQGYRGVTRFTITSRESVPCNFEVRYFEIAPGGYTRLERHAHVHSVTVLRGSGYAIVGSEIHGLGSHDHVYVPPQTLHQFVNDGDAPLGFLCVVDGERDRPEQPNARDLDLLNSNDATRGRYKL